MQTTTTRTWSKILYKKHCKCKHCILNSVAASEFDWNRPFVGFGDFCVFLPNTFFRSYWYYSNSKPNNISHSKSPTNRANETETVKIHKRSSEIHFSLELVYNIQYTKAVHIHYVYVHIQGFFPSRPEKIIGKYNYLSQMIIFHISMVASMDTYLNIRLFALEMMNHIFCHIFIACCLRGHIT